MIVTSPARPGPRILRGALAVYRNNRPGSAPEQLIVFQYNPESMRRSLATRTEKASPEEASDARQDVLQVPGPPVETINLTVELDAADQLELPSSNDTVAEHGLHPALAALELLMYPDEQQVEDADAAAERGEAQVYAGDLPLVLLVWGRSRVVPVKVTGFSVTEEAFDPQLNPIHAKVDLGLQVLTDLELPSGTLGFDAYRAHRRVKGQRAADHFQKPAEGTPGIEDLLRQSRT